MPARLGFSIRILGARDMPSHDARAWPQAPHLSVALVYLRDILHHLAAHRIHAYRMHSRLVPPADAWREQVHECAAELADVGRLAREYDVRLSFHPYSVAVLNGVNEDKTAAAIEHVTAAATMLDAMALGPEAVAVLHVGGVYDDIGTARQRFVQRYEALPPFVRRRLALEADDRRFGHADVRLIHSLCGIPLVFDTLHHLVHNPTGVPTREALAYCLGTWPAGVRPKIHFSSPRTEMRPLAGGSTPGAGRIKLPTWTEHADFVNPFEFIAFARDVADLLPFDVMLEAKARDLALLQLRDDLLRFAPDLAGRFE
jgi:UV DNA damage endonuclease